MTNPPDWKQDQAETSRLPRKGEESVQTMLKPCPFCGAAPEAPFENLRGDDDTDGSVKVWTMHHHCRGIDMWIEGGDEQECAENWNRRAASAPGAVREALDAMRNAEIFLKTGAGFAPDQVVDEKIGNERLKLKGLATVMRECAEALFKARAALTTPEEAFTERKMVPEIAFDPTNHHNALKCPYCNPKGLTFAEEASTASTVSEFKNELGNTIRITIEGPTSKSTNDLTPVETTKLNEALTRHFTCSAEASTATPQVIGCLRAECPHPEKCQDGWKCLMPVFAPQTSTAAGEAAAWQSIDTAPKDGTRLILAWDDIAALQMHWEVGRYRSGTGRGSGWCNTYGHPFSGVPTHWTIPPKSSAASAPPAAQTDGVREALDSAAEWCEIDDWRAVTRPARQSEEN